MRYFCFNDCAECSKKYINAKMQPKIYEKYIKTVWDFLSEKSGEKKRAAFAARALLSPMGKRSRFSLTKIAGKVIKGRLLALLCKLPRTPSSHPRQVMRSKYVI